ncbi:hypothetical protein [Microbulbifer sp. SAOS-129_SWC]|uniref:hypothetical protein n=1 Tax=Microbulbifer sp. SAOS-129_SWC TaxID=3145235 RepID=UPI003217E681
MPIHTNNTRNGRQLSAIKENYPAVLNGRTTHLPIYQIRASALIGNRISGDLARVLASIKKNNQLDLQEGYRQEALHSDTLGNLPVPPGAGVQYREYFVPGNGAHSSGYWRLVGDIRNHRLFITPTHYDIWLMDLDAAQVKDDNQEVAHTTTGAQNPFFHLTGVSAWSSLFW